MTSSSVFSPLREEEGDGTTDRNSLSKGGIQEVVIFIHIIIYIGIELKNRQNP